jgi:hypothetical protein
MSRGNVDNAYFPPNIGQVHCYVYTLLLLYLCRKRLSPDSYVGEEDDNDADA